MATTLNRSESHTQNHPRPSFRERLLQKVMVFDGAMGTSIQTYQLTAKDFLGKDGCNDYLSLIRPEIIQAIHHSFLEAGCDCVETNTFGSNRIKLEEYGLADQIVDINTAAVKAAQDAIAQVNTPNQPRYIVGSLGPTGFLPSSSDPTLSNVSVDTLREVYQEQAQILIEAGVDAIIVETGQDILEMKHAVIGAKEAIQASGKDILLIAQPTLDTSGRMLLGTDVETALPLFIDLGVDVFGINCSTGPDEMRESIRYLSQYSPVPISVIPNAGLPENIEGQAHYNLTPEPFAQALKEFISQFGIQIVGGCCGTTPKHLAALVETIGPHKPVPREIEPVRSLTSSIKAVSLDIPNKPLIVGERLNSQGSRKFKKLLMEDDYETMGIVARTLVEEGSHLLDVCVALNERDDEKEQMCRLVKDLSQLVDAPLVIDSTEYDVIEAALKLVPGRPIVNSIHLEGEGERVHRIAPFLKKYGGSAVAMLIDHDGMAKTAERKIEVAQKLYDIITQDYDLPPHTLIYDPLTFTLATGEDEFKNSAVETFEAIRWIKSNLPHTYTILGVSNASFGLTPEARRVLNSVYLYHATQAGLDLAIINAKEIIPYPMLTEQERQLADALVLNENEQALADFIAYFETHASADRRTSQVEEDDTVQRSVEEQIHYQILNRKKEGIEAVLEKALQQYAPVEIINQILLPAMKEVGDKMATGELILPFVLQSAEVMKKSVAYLEQFLDKDDKVSKGTLVLATVYGDVHDIGKNLVKTIFSNNGYVVHDLGKQVPLADILAKAKEVKADAIGLSALLVTTSKQMAYCVEECHKHEMNYPIIIGGAAINRDFGFRISVLGEEITYPGGVFYSKDAFEGLRVMNRLMDPQEKELLMKEYRLDMENRRKKSEKYKESAPAPIITTESQVKPAEKIPIAPFWGMKRLQATDLNLDDIYPLMDFPSLFRLSWGVKNKAKEEYDRLLQEEFYPLLADLLNECKTETLLQPEVLYGYLPCYSEGNDLVVLQDDLKTERERFQFPRQTSRDLLCLSDYFASKDSGKTDVLPLQLVTMGYSVGAKCNALDQAGEYSKSYYLHGLAVQMAEALAEWSHRMIRKELGIENGQGKRYSFGYPACPDLSDQVKQFALMEVSTYTNILLTEAYQIEPEQSTSALIVHHPDAKYYSI